MIEETPNYPDPEVTRAAILGFFHPRKSPLPFVLHPDATWSTKMLNDGVLTTSCKKAKALGILPDYVLLNRNIPPTMGFTITTDKPLGLTPIHHE